MGQERVRAKDLPADCDWKREWNLGSEGTIGSEALGETAGDPLCSNSIIPLVHVWTGRPDEESEVREVPATLRNTTGCMLGCTGEWQVGSWKNGISRDDEPDEEPHGWRRRLSRKLQTAGLGPRKKNSSDAHGSPGGGRLDLVECREEPGGHRVRESDHGAPDGEAILENGLWVWKPGDDGPILARVGGANLPIDGGGTASSN